MLSNKLFSGLFRNRFKINSRHIITSIFPDLELERKTIAEHVFCLCDTYSEKIAFIDDTRKINYNYNDFKNSMKSIASSLTKRGVIPGTMVGIIASNSPEYIMLAYALSSMGCTVTLCNQNYTENELHYQLMDSKPSILFTNDEYLEKVSKTASQLSNVKDIYLIGSRKAGYVSVDDLMNDSGNMNPIGQVKVDLDNHIALMPYSSGTTGLAKGVMLTHINITTSCRQMKSVRTVDANRRLLLVLPLYHIYAMAIITGISILSGSTMVIQPRFQPMQFLTAIDEYKITSLHLVPPIVLFLINHPDSKKFKLTSLEKLMCGAAPLDDLIEKKIMERFRPSQPKFEIFQGYGLTETSGSSHIVPSGKTIENKQGSIGLLVPNMQCKIVNTSTRAEVSTNESGEILLRGPNVMKGYFGKASASEKAFENEWFKTGDVGYYDNDHFFYINDRFKDIIKVKAYQVSPAELETALLSFPGIVDCAVIGVPDERDGEVPRAFVVTNKDIHEKEIHEYMNCNLSQHKQLKGGIFFIKNIPKSPSGKILRNLLRSN